MLRVCSPTLVALELDKAVEPEAARPTLVVCRELWFIDVPESGCEMSPSQVFRCVSPLEPLVLVHLLCGWCPIGSSSKLVSCSTRVPKLCSSVPSHDHESSSESGKVHPSCCSALSLLPTMPRRWSDNAIGFPPFGWVVRVLIGSLEEPVQLILLLFSRSPNCVQRILQPLESALALHCLPSVQLVLGFG